MAAEERRLIRVSQGSISVTVEDVAAEIVVEAVAHQSEINGAPSGQVTFHWGPEGISVDVLKRYPRQKRHARRESVLS